VVIVKASISAKPLELLWMLKLPQTVSLPVIIQILGWFYFSFPLTNWRANGFNLPLFLALVVYTVFAMIFAWLAFVFWLDTRLEKPLLEELSYEKAYCA
jgi:hypothetical protein